MKFHIFLMLVLKVHLKLSTVQVTFYKYLCRVNGWYLRHDVRGGYWISK